MSIGVYGMGILGKHADADLEKESAVEESNAFFLDKQDDGVIVQEKDETQEQINQEYVSPVYTQQMMSQKAQPMAVNGVVPGKEMVPYWTANPNLSIADEFERVALAKLVPIRGIESFDFQRNKILISGYAYFLDMMELSAHKIEHNLIIMKVTKDAENPTVLERTPVASVHVSPSTNDTEIENLHIKKPKNSEFDSSEAVINVIESMKRSAYVDERQLELLELDAQHWEEYEKAKDVYRNYRYDAVIDLATVANGEPLSDGTYEIYMQLRQYVDGRWIAQEFSIGEIENAVSDTVYVSKLRKYGRKALTTYSLGITQEVNTKSIKIKTKKLSKVNPADLIVHDDVLSEESTWKKNVKMWAFSTAYKLFKLLPIKENGVAFISDSRVDLSGNFEYIYEEILRRDSNFESTFYFKQTNNEPKSLHEYIALAKAIATNRYVLLDDFYPLIYSCKIRKGVDLIQVWHAVGAFKTFGFSRVGMKGGPKLASLNHRNYTKAIVSSEGVAPHYAEGFGIDQSRVVPLGAPRTDMFFDEAKKKDIVEKLYADMPFLKDKKVILFAPTFRGPGQQTAYYPFDWLDYQELYEHFASEGFVFLFKIHPFVKNSPSIPYEYSDFFYDVSDYREVNDLLLLSDVMITDYSSVVFEYSLLKRKTIFFSPDLSDYMGSRNFYVDYLDFIPGTYVSDIDGLISEIETYDQVNEEKLDNFLNYYFDDLDGKASSRFVDAMENGFEDPEEIIYEGVNEAGKRLPKFGTDIRLDNQHMSETQV